jgi:hypothetical protein
MEFNFTIEQPKTWFIDLDGTIVEHNGYKNGGDVLLNGVKPFFDNINSEDIIIITTARSSYYSNETISFLNNNGIRYDKIIFDLPTGERILINDKKPDNKITAIAVNLDRNEGLKKLI